MALLYLNQYGICWCTGFIPVRINILLSSLECDGWWRCAIFLILCQWLREIKEFCPSKPIILVGCKLDLRNDITVITDLAKSRRIPVSRVQVHLLIRFWENFAKVLDEVAPALYARRRAMFFLTQATIDWAITPGEGEGGWFPIYLLSTGTFHPTGYHFRDPLLDRDRIRAKTSKNDAPV